MSRVCLAVCGAFGILLAPMSPNKACLGQIRMAC
uniref:Uncharacterized protein n=2 Tax=Setaria TaxID=4554 RepID=K3ZPU1_SETIT|nr:hypothetical protein SEVIR_8G090751v2 [Setaria viridis]